MAVESVQEAGKTEFNTLGLTANQRDSSGNFLIIYQHPNKRLSSRMGRPGRRPVLRMGQHGPVFLETHYFYTTGTYQLVRLAALYMSRMPVTQIRSPPGSDPHSTKRASGKPRTSIAAT